MEFANGMVTMETSLLFGLLATTAALTAIFIAWAWGLLLKQAWRRG